MIPLQGAREISILRLLVALSAVLYALLGLDFLTHPFHAGYQAATGIPYLFRWLSMGVGSLTLVIAIFIMNRVRGNTVGPLLFVIAVGAAGWSLRTEWATPDQAAAVTFLYAIYAYSVASPAGIALFFYFPTGQAYPDWLNRGLPFGLSLASLAGLLQVLGTSTDSGLRNPFYLPSAAPWTNLFGILLPLLGLAALVTLILRYRTRDARGRLQLKWLLWLSSLVVFTIFVLFAIPPEPMARLLGEHATARVRVASWILVQSTPAVAIGIAMLRHKLWDIDIIIRRTVTYSILTALLVAVFFPVWRCFSSYSPHSRATCRHASC